MNNEESDIIIVGAGASGCVIAARLAAADPKLRILVLESGSDTPDDPVVAMPARFLEVLNPASPWTRVVLTSPDKQLPQSPMPVATGRCVGGSSVISLMVYTRPSASDLDNWELQHENPGWGYKDMLPMFKKFETFEPLKDSPTHGYGGPVHISLGSPSPIINQWLNVMGKYDKTMAAVDDINDFSVSNAYSRLPIAAANGIRQDAAHCFLYPALRKLSSNVVLRSGCTVDRIVFEGYTAVGVEYHSQDTTTRMVVRAKKFVVLSAGGLGSSLLLERSGIGSPAVLSAAGVQVRVALEGVGENYHDHHALVPMYISAPGVTDDRDAYVLGDQKVREKANAQYERDRSGICATTGTDAAAKVRPRTAEEAKAIGLNQALLSNWSFFKSDKPLFITHLVSGNIFANGEPGTNYFTAVSYSAYPFSRGRVHICSANSDDPPIFETGSLSHPADISVMMWQYKWTRERARRMPAYRGEFAETHPDFAKESEARTGRHSIPVAIDAPDIVYTAADNDVLATWIRQMVQTNWPPMGTGNKKPRLLSGVVDYMGTCAMKPRHLGGVVDPRLNVYGLRGLKVADMSIAPEHVGCNTLSVAMAIGEKAAVLIAEDLGFSL